MNYTSFGGTYQLLTGANAGTFVFGQDPLWLAWANDLINFKIWVIWLLTINY